MLVKNYCSFSVSYSEFQVPTLHFQSSRNSYHSYFSLFLFICSNFAIAYLQLGPIFLSFPPAHLHFLTTCLTPFSPTGFCQNVLFTLKNSYFFFPYSLKLCSVWPWKQNFMQDILFVMLPSKVHDLHLVINLWFFIIITFTWLHDLIRFLAQFTLFFLLPVEILSQKAFQGDLYRGIMPIPSKLSDYNTVPI